MSTYVIGDVHGCLDGLKRLLDLIDYNPDEDRLLFAGDLVGRGPHSYGTLKFIHGLKQAQTVLGNHEIHLLCSFHLDNNHKKVDYIEQFIKEPDADAMIEWLCQQPLCHYEPKFKAILVHAGIHPEWKLSDLFEYSNEFSSQLSDPSTRINTLSHAYGNFPDIWRSNLIGSDRLRVILNIFTRIRYLKAQDNRLNYFCKTQPKQAPEELKAWFNYKLSVPVDHTVIFGHWAHLRGSISTKSVESIDGGYVHQGKLIALRLEDKLRFNLNYPTE